MRKLDQKSQKRLKINDFENSTIFGAMVRQQKKNYILNGWLIRKVQERFFRQSKFKKTLMKTNNKKKFDKKKIWGEGWCYPFNQTAKLPKHWNSR